MPKCSLFFSKPQPFFSPAAKNVARPKSRAALRATSLAAAVGQHGYVDPMTDTTGCRLLGLKSSPSVDLIVLDKYSRKKKKKKKPKSGKGR